VHQPHTSWLVMELFCWVRRKTPLGIIPLDGRLRCSPAISAVPLFVKSMPPVKVFSITAGGVLRQCIVLAPRGCLTVAPPDREPELDDLLAMSEPGEEVSLIEPVDACDMVPFLRPDRAARAVFEADVTDIEVAILLLSYLKGAKARGAMVVTEQPVVAVSLDASVWNVQTTKPAFPR
jgi:hypothetical protein